jgi:hypothetical protein
VKERATPPDEVESEPSFPLDALLEFVADLREEYAFGVDEFIAVQEVVLGLSCAGKLPSEPKDLEGYIRPILCSNRREQEDFHARYATFLESLERRGKRELPSSPPKSDEVLRWDALRRWDLKVNWFFAALAAFAGIALVALVVDLFRASEPSRSPRRLRRPSTSRKRSSGSANTSSCS